jgi:hypothetical protein
MENLHPIDSSCEKKKYTGTYQSKENTLRSEKPSKMSPQRV